LVAAWREALLAQKVLAGRTRGYKHHPQLIRFQNHPKPDKLIAAFLRGIASEAARRGYRFDTSKISSSSFRGRIPETSGQLQYEWKHLKSKLRSRAPELYREFADISVPEAHTLFRIVLGEIRDWERK
jgi:hypothetical protein